MVTIVSICKYFSATRLSTAMLISGVIARTYECRETRELNSNSPWTRRHIFLQLAGTTQQHRLRPSVPSD